MPFTTTLTATSSNPFETFRRRLIASLLAMKAPPAYPAYPIPSDHLAVNRHILQAVSYFDEWLSACGHQVAVNSSSEVDQRLFNGVLRAAVEGDACYLIEQVAEQMIEERPQRRRA